MKIYFQGCDIAYRLSRMKWSNEYEIRWDKWYISPLSDELLCDEVIWNGEYIVLDLYGSLYTTAIVNEKRITLNSLQHNDAIASEIIRYKQMTNEWMEERIKKYAHVVLNHFEGKKIILIRSQKALYSATQNQLRFVRENHEEINRLLRHIEDVFVKETGCIDIDIAKFFASDFFSKKKNKGLDYQNEFWEECFFFINQIIAKELNDSVLSPRYITIINQHIRFYNHTRVTNLWKVFLDDNNFLDHIVINLGKKILGDFKIQVAALKELNCSSYSEIYSTMDEKNALFEAILCIESISDKKLYTWNYDVVFEYDMPIKKALIPLVCEELQKNNLLGENAVTENNVKDYINILKHISCEDYKSALLAAFSMSPKIIPQISIDIWGSCISRETYNASNGVLRLQEYLYRCCGLHAFEKKIDLDLDLFEEHDFRGAGRKKNIYTEMYRMGPKRLLDSTSSWILLDFYDFQESCFKYHSSPFILDLNSRNTNFFERINKYCEKHEYYLTDWEDVKKQLDKMIKFLLQRYDHNIIIIRCKLQKTYLDFQRNLCLFERNDLDIKNNFLKRCEDYFIDQTGCYSIDFSKFFLGDERSVWGAAPVHYEPFFFYEASRVLNEICLGKTEQRCFSEYSYSLRIERILSYKKEGISEEAIKRIINDRFIDAFVCSLDKDVIKNNIRDLLHLYRLDINSWDELVNQVQFLESDEMKRAIISYIGE